MFILVFTFGLYFIPAFSLLITRLTTEDFFHSFVGQMAQRFLDCGIRTMALHVLGVAIATIPLLFRFCLEGRVF